MVTTSKSMSPVQAASYYEKDDYYTKDAGQGEWFGEGAKVLDLTGEAHKKDFYAVANGFNPGKFTDDDYKTARAFDSKQKDLEQKFKAIDKIENEDLKRIEFSKYKKDVEEFNKNRKDFIVDKTFEAKPKAIEREFVMDEVVSPIERGNFGKVVAINGEYADVHFVASPDPDKPNEEPKEFTGTFHRSELSSPSEKSWSVTSESRKLVDDSYDKETRILSHKRAGFDMTSSAPKSVSIMAEIKNNELFIKAHTLANAEMLSYAEKNFTQTRTYDKETKSQIIVDGSMVATQFTHHSARAAHKDLAPDPQLHTHNFIHNMAQDADGNWHAMEPKELYKHQAMLGQVYQNALAREVQRMGYDIEWNSQKNGNYTFEIVDMRKEIDHFSKRTETIKEHISKLEKEHGALTPAQVEIAKNEIRETKVSQDLEKLKENWKSQLNDLNIKEKYSSPISNSYTKEDLSTIVDNAINEVEKYDSVMSRHKVIHEALKYSQGKYKLNEISKAVDNHEQIFQLDKHQLGTKDLLEKEKKIISDLKSSKNTFQQIANSHKVDEFLSKQKTVTVAQLEAGAVGIKADQKAFIKEVLTSEDQMSTIQGDAGTGKTFAIKNINNFIKENELNYEVIGLAPTGKAASELASKAGIKSQTIDKFLLSKEQGKEVVMNLKDVKNLGFSKRQVDFLTKDTTINKEVMKGYGSFLKEGFAHKIGKIAYRISPPMTKVSQYFKSTYTNRTEKATKNGIEYTNTTVRQTNLMKAYGLKEWTQEKTTFTNEGKINKSIMHQDKSGNLTSVSIRDGKIMASIKPHSQKEWVQIGKETKKIYVIDEASMVSTKKMTDLLTKINDSKSVFIGDKKQLKAVEQGSMFEKMQNANSSSNVVMAEKTRQKTSDTKALVKDFEAGKVKEAFAKLEAKGNLVENSNIKELKSSFIKDVSNAMIKSGTDSAIAIVSKNEQRKEFNETIRNELKNANIVSKAGVKVEILEAKKMTDFDKKQISNYEKGDVLKTSKFMGDMKANSEVKITNVNKNSKTVDVEYKTKFDKTKTATFNMEKTAKFESFKCRDIELAKGDKVIFTKNTKGFENGKTGEIISVNKELKTAKISIDGKESKVDFSKEKHLDHGYSMTSHKTQGMDTKQAFVYNEAKDSNNKNSGYTEVTRAETNVKYYTDDKNKAIEKYSAEQKKENLSDDKYKEVVNELKKDDKSHSLDESKSSGTIKELQKELEKLEKGDKLEVKQEKEMEMTMAK